VIQRRVVTLTVAAFALLSPAPSAAFDWIALDGYIKSFAVVFDPAKIDNATEQPDATWANNNRARANLVLYPARWLQCDVSYDLSLRLQDADLFESNPFFVFRAFSIYRVGDLERELWSNDPEGDPRVLLLQNLDRLFVTFRVSWCDLFVGRQAIAWGSGHAVNPTDIIAPFLYTEIDTEDRTGVDAARLRLPAGSLAEVDVGYVAGEDFDWSESAAYGRCRLYAAGTDISAIAMVFRDNVMAGLDATRALGGAGTWCEAAYVWGGAARSGDREEGDTDYLRLSAGADYNFGAGVYVFAEYHFNGAGESSPDYYLENVFTNTTAYLDGAVYLLGRHYVIPGISWQATPLVTVFAEVLGNLNDGSLMLAPYVEYNATDNLYLSAGLYGSTGSSPRIVGGGQFWLGTEFGAYPTQYYAFARYYF
jgi:hypothetical protein